METLQLRVEGMECAGCAASVQRALEQIEGVNRATVSVTAGQAVIEGTDLREEALVEVVEGRGFEACLMVDSPTALEWRSDIEHRQEQSERQWRFRALVGLGVWLPLALLHWFTEAVWWHEWLFLGGATVVMATAGAGFYKSAWKAAKKRTTNMDTLIAIGATTAYGFSLVVFIAELFDRSINQPLYFLEAAALLGIIGLGHWLEALSTAKAGSAVRELLELQPEQAERLDGDDQPLFIASADVQPGDRLLIRPGARIPVDGEVVEGASEVDEAVVTGESLPVRRLKGDRVVAGSMNTTGRLVIRATVDGGHTSITRIAEMVQQAQASKANIQRLADRVCGVFVPTVLSIAALTLVGWILMGQPFTGLVAMVTVLIISCPCALGLATPMAVMVGAGAASRRGILIKSAMALETAGNIKRVVFDKTGTLTEGRPRVTEVRCGSSEMNEETVLQLAASAEGPSEHPIGRAIVREADRRGLETSPVQDFAAATGEGVRGMVQGKRVEVGRDEWASCGVKVDGEGVGTITVLDTLRPDAEEGIHHLRALGLQVTMLSGDRMATAREIGSSLGLEASDIVGEATPESKSELIQTLRIEGGVAMVGDGINDAAALAEADLGIAMASGTNIAIESAEVVIASDQVTAVAETIDIARRTLSTIRQNLFFAFFYNAAMIPAAALGMLGEHGPLIAAFAMAGSDITVVGNALRLRSRLRRLRL